MTIKPRTREPKAPFTARDEERTFVLLHILKKANDFLRLADLQEKVGALTEAAQLNLIHRHLMKLGNEIRNLEHIPPSKESKS